MSIAIIVAPQRSDIQTCAAISPLRLSDLVERAANAGKVIALRRCESDAEVVESLRCANDAHAEFVIFDPGESASRSASVRAMLSAFEVPYVEAHDDDFGALEPALARDCGPRLGLIQGYGSLSYSVALSIALEHLGCSDAGNDYHVGT